MALIPSTFLDTVVAIGHRLADGNISFSATGFLCGYPTGSVNDDGRPLYYVFLVTNHHVVAEKENITIRMNTLLGDDTQIYDLGLRGDTTLSGGIVNSSLMDDVAIVALDLAQLTHDGINLEFIPDEFGITREECNEIGVSEGDGVFVLGFPLGVIGDDRNYTIVRQGTIARIQDFLCDKSRTLLIDASVFPGNSGGPVFTKPEVVSVAGTNANTGCRLIGMVTSYLPYRDIAISSQTGNPRITFEENSGLCNIVSYSVIKEAILESVRRQNSKE